jgi:hypothetical protein
MTMKCIKWPQNIPNGRNTYQHFPLQNHPEFTQIGIFGLKICMPSGNPAFETNTATGPICSAWRNQERPWDDCIQHARVCADTFNVKESQVSATVVEGLFS